MDDGWFGHRCHVGPMGSVRLSYSYPGHHIGSWTEGTKDTPRRAEGQRCGI